MIEIQAKHVSTEKQKTQTKIVFSTSQKLDDLELSQIEKAQGFLYFNADKVAQEKQAIMMDSKVGVSVNGKSPSKQLRAALYDYWFAKIKDQTFDDWYVLKMQGIIKMVTDKI